MRAQKHGQQNGRRCKYKLDCTQFSGTSWTGVRTDTSMKSFQRDASSDMQQVYGKCSCTERFAEDVTLSRIHFASHLRNEMKLDDLTGEMTGAVTGKMGAVYVMVLTIYRFSRFCAAIVTFCGISGRRIPVSHKTSDFCSRFLRNMRKSNEFLGNCGTCALYVR